MTTGMGLDGLTITASDVDAALRFYDAALGAIGFVRTHELVDEEEDDATVEAAGWGPADGTAQLWVVTGGLPTSGLHVRFRAASRVDVDEFHEAGLAAGGTTHAAPRRWTPFRRGEYGAALRDPGGNVVEVVAPE